MTRIVPMFLDSDQTTETWYSAVDMRSMVALVSGGTGVRGMAPTIANQTTSPRVVQVGAGMIVVPDTNPSPLAAWVCYMDAPENVTVPVAPAAGQFRTDLIVARVRPAQRDWILDVVPGTVSTTAPGARPAIPALCAPICSVPVTGGQPTLANAALTDLRAPVAPLGTPARVSWVRSANIATANSYTDVGVASGPGAVPTTAFFTPSNPAGSTVLTVTRDCYLALMFTARCQGSGGCLRFRVDGDTDYIVDQDLSSQGGGLYAGHVGWSSLFHPGETVTANFRTAGGGTFYFANQITAFAAAPF